MSSIRRRARNLSDKDIERIVGICDGWSGELTWQGLIDAISLHHGVTYTRQALHRHPRIQLAYTLAKKRLEGQGLKKTEAPAALTPSEATLVLQQQERLKAEVERLKVENARLLEQFVVWAVNAHQAGLDLDYLNRPLPPVDRSQSDKPKTRRMKIRG